MRNKHSLANFARFVSIAIVSELCLSECSERVSGGTINRRRSKTGENSRECVYAWRGGGFRTYAIYCAILLFQLFDALSDVVDHLLFRQTEGSRKLTVEAVLCHAQILLVYCSDPFSLCISLQLSQV